MMPKRRFVHFIPNLNYGGAESFLLRLASNLKGRHYIVTYWDNSFMPPELPRSVCVINITFDLMLFSKSLKLIRLLNRLDSSDLILSWLYVSDVIASICALVSFSKARLVWNIRNTVVTREHYSWMTMFSFHLSRSIFKKAPRYIVYNSHRARRQHEALGYPEQKSRVIYNGFVDYVGNTTARIPIDKELFNIACVARFHKQKNHQLLFSALELIPEVPFHLHLIGPGIDSENSELIDRLTSLLPDSYTLYGPKPAEFVHSLFRDTDISVLPSNIGESFPNVIAESMIQGCYPVCLDVGDASLIVKGHGTCLPVSCTPAELATTILFLFKRWRYSSDIWIKQSDECKSFARSEYLMPISVSRFRELLS